MKLAKLYKKYFWIFKKKKKKKLIYFEKGYACIFILFLLSNFLIVGGS